MALEEYSAEQLAQMTGVPAGTLRVWESRYGFPDPIRLSSNRKRYDDSHVRQVNTVVQFRRDGLSLAAAIERVRGGGTSVPRSLFAALRRARPDIPVRVFPKRTLIALSRAIEDEHAARVTGGLLLGSFQHERHYRASERRWRELTRTADATMVLADFPALRIEPGHPVEIPLEESHPLEREWTVVLHSASATACLAAWEVPAPRELPELDRSFELLWTCDPRATRVAVDAAAALVNSLQPGLRLPSEMLDPATPVGIDPGFSDDLTSRAFAYMAAA